MGSRSELNHGPAPSPADARRAPATEILPKQKAVKAEPIPLRPGLTVAQGLQAIASSCLTHFRENQALILEAKDAEALHQARVAMRRLRSAFALFRPVIKDEETRRLKEELRWLLAEFGDARNLDVYLERNLSEEQRRFANERRTDAYDRVGAALGSIRARQLLLDVLKWLERGAWRDHPEAEKRLGPFLRPRIDQLWKKVSHSRAVRRMNDERRHRLRIGVKKLRYALEFADGLHPGNRRRKAKFGRAVRDVQQSLGRLHDDVTAASMMALNSWLSTEPTSRTKRTRLAHHADQAIARLRRIGPYWHHARAAA